MLGFVVVFLLLRQFPGVEKRTAEKYEIVERAIEARAADAVQHARIFVPGFRENAIESLQREGGAIVAAEHARRFEICGDEHRVPGDVESRVDGWNGRRSRRAARSFPLARASRMRAAASSSCELRCEIFDRGRDPEDIFRRVVVHFAARLHVVVNFDRARFLGREHRAHFVERPGEIVAVVIERLIGVLAAVKSAALLIRENFVDPSNDSFGGFAEERVVRHLIAVQIIFQQLGIVVRHFLEVRDAPALVNRIAMEAAGDLIVNAAQGHSFERAFGDVQQARIAG